MANFRVGRIGLDSELESLSSVSVDGDLFTITGRTVKMTYQKATQVRSQFAGYTDEIVPVVSDDLPDLNGFYRFVSATVEASSDVGVFGIFDFSLRVERVQGFGAPVFESMIRGAARANFQGTPQPFHALPASVDGYETGTLTPNVATRAANGGNVSVFTTSGTDYYKAAPQYFLDIDQWHVGAAVLTVDGSIVVGRQVRNAPQSWVLSNGLIRLTSEATGWFRTERWNGSAWVNSGSWALGRRVGSGSSATYPRLDPPHTITVMRNSEQAVSIRLTTDASSAVSGARFAVTVDVELRRGALMADTYLSSRGAYAWNWRTPLSTSYSTDATGRWDSVYAVGILSNSSTDTDASGVRIGSAFDVNVFSLGVGHRGSSGIDTPQAVISQWGAVQSETVTVVAR